LHRTRANSFHVSPLVHSPNFPSLLLDPSSSRSSGHPRCRYTTLFSLDRNRSTRPHYPFSFDRTESPLSSLPQVPCPDGRHLEFSGLSTMRVCFHLLSLLSFFLPLLRARGHYLNFDPKSVLALLGLPFLFSLCGSPPSPFFLPPATFFP